MEKYCEPLYRCDPSVIPQHLPSLLYTIRMIFTTSRYYNNTASVTAILVKISNQMINSCRSYLNCEGTKTVWIQPKKEVMEKMKICLDLYLKYYQCFKHTQSAMQEAGEPNFDCSEMYVFGKFETFKRRLEEVKYPTVSVQQKKKIIRIFLADRGRYRNLHQVFHTSKQHHRGHRLLCK